MKAALVLALCAAAVCVAVAQKTTYASLAEALADDDRLTTFAELVKKHSNAFNPEKSFKGLLFAPSNKAWADAFEVLKAAGVPLNPVVIDKILQYHQVATAYYAQDLPEGVALKTNLQGAAPLVVSYDNGAIRYNAAGSVAGIAKSADGSYQDKTIGDAVLNVVDTVLLPFKLGAGKQKLTADGLAPVDDVEATSKAGASTVGNLPKPAEATPGDDASATGTDATTADTATGTDATTADATTATDAVGAQSVLDTAQQAVGNAIDTVGNALGNAAEAVTSAVGAGVDAVKGAASGIKQTAEERLAALTADGVDTNMDAGIVGNLTGLFEALEFADLPFKKLNPDWVGTIFAPENAAFDALRGPDGAFAMTPADMGKALLAHSINGTAVFSDEIENGQEFVTSAGTKLKAVIEDGLVFIETEAGESAAVILSDITYGDNVIHVIDGVLGAGAPTAPEGQPGQPVSAAVARGPLAALLTGAAVALALVLA